MNNLDKQLNMKKEEEPKKGLIICGIIDMYGNPVKRTEEEQKEFCDKLSNNGEYNVIFDETNTIPNLMKNILPKNNI
jgi:hypothetical protein